MPSKGKKPSGPSPASSDRSLASRTPSRTPDRRPETTTNGGGGGDDDEVLFQQLLSEASAKYPSLISDSAFCGRVSELDPSPSKGNHATVWLSEAAMVSYSLAPGSLVSVSLVGKGCNFPFDSLTEECARHFGIDVDNSLVSEAGCYFAIASVFPSRKVLKNGVRLSWGVSCTMGFPDIGRSIFVSLVNNLSTSQQPNKTRGVSHFYIFKCKDLYLKMVPPKDELVTLDEGLSRSDNKTESVGVQIGNRKVLSPKTPSYQSRLSSPISNQLHSRKSKESASNLDSSLCWDTSAARLALADEKVNELLQIYAARWLYGRHLLGGNFVTVPICGQFCVFQVEGADKLPADCSNQNLMREGKADMLPHEIQTSDSLDEVDAAHLVGTKTKIHLSDPKSLIGEHPNKEILPTGDPKSNAIRDKEAGDVSRLGGLSKEFAALKEIIAFSLVNKNALPRYKGVLLHGLPGTGKTSLASSRVREAGVSFFSINGPKIVILYYGVNVAWSFRFS